MRTNIFLFFYFLFFLGGCAQNSETKPGQISLENINTIELKTIFNFELTGFDSDGNSIAASARLVNEANVLGVEEPDIVQTLAINSSQIFDQFEFRIYRAISPESELIALGQSTGELCNNTLPDKLPDSVSIGDSGVLNPLDCFGIFTRYRSWFVEETINGNIRITIEQAEIPKRSNFMLREMSYILDSDWNIKNIEIKLDFYRVTLDEDSNPVLESEVSYSLGSNNS